jgi:hypothetical protein
MGKIAQNTKKRNWAFVVYPESAPADLFEQLQQTGLPVAVSPLHDQDLEADGITPKKPHWHVILAYSGPQTYKAVKTLTDRLHAPAPIPLDAVRGYYRYFTHKDNPEKAQYREEDIILLNGFSILDWVELSRGEISKIKNALRLLIKELDLVEYSEFMDHVAEHRSPEEFDVASNNTFFFNTYLTSRRNQPRGKPSGGGADLARESEE